MSTINAQIHVKDSNGTVYDVNPSTTIANVEGLQTTLNSKADSTTVNNQLSGKVDKETGKGLSTNDYTTAEKNKLSGIEAQANKTVVDSALSSSSENPVQNKVVNTALGTKQDTLSSAQLAAVNSGIDSSKVTQISTNQTNISSAGATTLKCASIAEYYSAKQLNGVCYVGNNTIVYYCNDSSSNIGVLVAFNCKTYAELWRHNIELYHGNSLTYNPNNNCIYAAACYDAADTSVLTNKIFEIDLSEPDRIKRTITLDNNAYSCVYNQSNRKFYVTAYRGTTEGQANRIYIYNESFNQESYIDLELFPSVLYGVSTQGVGLAVKDRLYVLMYERASSILEYDLNGNLIKVYDIPSIVNDYRLITEVQAIYYDETRDIIGFAFLGTDQLHSYSITFADTNITKDIYVNHWVLSGEARTRINVEINNSTPSNYQPAHVTHILKSVSDGLSLMSGYAGRINFNITGDDIIHQLNIINPKNASFNFNDIKITNGLSIIGGMCTIRNCDVSGSVTHLSGYNSAVLVTRGKALFDYVDVTPPTDQEAANYCFIAHEGAEILLNSTITYTGNIGFASFCGSIKISDTTIEPTIHLASTAIPDSKIKVYDGAIAEGQTYDFNRIIYWGSCNSVLLGTVLKFATAYTINDMPDNTNPSTIHTRAFIESNKFYIINIKITIDKTNNQFTVNEIKQLDCATGTVSTRNISEFKIYFSRI